MSRIQDAIESNFEHVLHDHPHDVVSPHQTDDSPGQWRHKPTLTAHENRRDLRRDDCKEKARTGIWRVSKRTPCAHYKQHKMTACDELQEHHCLQLWMLQVMNRVAEIQQAETLDNAE